MILALHRSLAHRLQKEEMTSTNTDSELTVGEDSWFASEELLIRRGEGSCHRGRG